MDQLLYALDSDGQRIMDQIGWSEEKKAPIMRHRTTKTKGGSIAAVETCEAADALCQEIHRRFPSAKGRVHAVHSKTPDADRENIVGQFGAKHRYTIISPGAYLKGLHHLDISQLVVYKFAAMRETTLPDICQMLGRSAGIYCETKLTVILRNDDLQKKAFNKFRQAIKHSLQTDHPASRECPRPGYHRFYILGDTDPLIGAHPVPDPEYEFEDFDQYGDSNDEAAVDEKAYGWQQAGEQETGQPDLNSSGTDQPNTESQETGETELKMREDH
jgi:hypothetical protein